MIDDNIDMIADQAGDRFGHADQIDKVAGKPTDLTPDGDEA